MVNLKSAKDIEFKPYIHERDGCGKLIDSVSSKFAYSYVQEFEPRLKRNEPPSLIATQLKHMKKRSYQKDIHTSMDRSLDREV